MLEMEIFAKEKLKLGLFSVCSLGVVAPKRCLLGRVLLGVNLPGDARVTLGYTRNIPGAL